MRQLKKAANCFSLKLSGVEEKIYSKFCFHFRGCRQASNIESGCDFWMFSFWWKIMDFSVPQFTVVSLKFHKFVFVSLSFLLIFAVVQGNGFEFVVNCNDALHFIFINTNMKLLIFCWVSSSCPRIVSTSPLMGFIPQKVKWETRYGLRCYRLF